VKENLWNSQILHTREALIAPITAEF